MTTSALEMLKAAAPGNADMAFRAGAAAVKQGLADQALPMLEAAARANPGDARLWQVLGLAHRRREDMAAAIKAFGEAARLAPGDPLIAHSLARVTLEAGLPATALFDKAARIAPGDGSVLQGRAAAQVAEGRTAAAIADLDALLARSPGWIEGQETLARLRWMSGARADFTAALERALATAPRDPNLWKVLFDALLHAELYDELLAAIARGRAAMGNNALFDNVEAACVAEQGETEAADRLFARLGPPTHVNMALRYARHLLRAGRADAAAAFLEPWRDRDPGHDLVPYVAVAWRLTGDPRWQWLEGDPRLIGVQDLEVGDLAALAERLRGLHLMLHQPLEQSLRGGTQTDGALFARIEPEIRALRAAIVAAVEAHVAQLPPVDPSHPLLKEARNAPVRFAGSWSVRLTDVGYHINHVHSAGWLSSAFYVALPECGAGDGDFAGWLSLGEVTELGLDLAPIRLVEPRPGRLALFPSTMWHGTRPFAAGERMTVAFDVARPSA